jgi:thiamine biosynthesis lipoprotein
MNQLQPDSLVDGSWYEVTGARRFCHEAMATTFEIYIQHDNIHYAQQAARAAFNELDHLEAELSRFIENSDISRINNLAAGQTLRIGLAAFECLQQSFKIYNETNGAFDVTIGSLLNRWLNKDKTLRSPSQAELDVARQRTGMNLIRLDEANVTIELLTSPMQIDLGGIGKGYALDKMAELLREWSIDTVLLHGGYSSVLALDAPASERGWPVTLSNPRNRKQTLCYLYLHNRAVSASGLQWGWHIIDPRQAKPVEGPTKSGLIPSSPSGWLAAWACAADAATADALSTAFMVMTPDEIRQYCSRHPQIQALVILDHESKEVQKDNILCFGSWDVQFENL